MSTWTSPASDSYHFRAALDAPPHSTAACTKACRCANRRGWIGWVAKDAVADPDNDPNGQDPSGLPARWRNDSPSTS